MKKCKSVVTERKSAITLDEESKKQILYEFHDAPVGGHRGMNQTLRTIKAQYTWPNMRQDVERYVKKCKSCQVNKVLGPRQKVLMEITSTTTHPFDKCYLDIVCPLPLYTAGNKYSLTFQDDLSKYMVATLINQQDATTVAKAFVSQIVLKYRAN